MKNERRSEPMNERAEENPGILCYLIFIFKTVAIINCS